MYKVLSKKVYKLPKGITTIYEIEVNYLGNPLNFFYSRTVSSSGKISFYVETVYNWKDRKYKYYHTSNVGIYQDMEWAVKEYEDQLT